MLELTCLGLTTSDEQEMFERLVKSEHLHWGELLEQAVRHKSLPALAFHILSTPAAESVSPILRAHLRATLTLNSHKTTILRAQAAAIAQALAERNLRFVGRKGIVFESSLYGANGSRRMGDIDFMIAPGDRDTVSGVMSELGYQVGVFDWQTGKIPTSICASNC
jgi:hypothetical protein